MTLRSLPALCLVVYAALPAQSANATPLTYNVIDLIAGLPSITGTITTDGTLGILSESNIIGWNLTLMDNVDSAPVVSGTNNSLVHLDGNALVATLTQLTFNFSQGDGSDFFFLDDTPFFDGEVCYTADSNCWGPAGVGVFNVDGDGGAFFTAYSGEQVIAEAEAAPVPEPASVLLLGAGLVVVAKHLRRRPA